LICEACEGEGYRRGKDPANPGALVLLPCLECNGSGIASCCDTAGSPMSIFSTTNEGEKNYYLKEWRQERGMTQEDLAAALKTSKGEISRYERGERPLTLLIQFRLMRALNITPAQFFEPPAMPHYVAAYRDDTFEPRKCDYCGEQYRGPAVYCSLECATDDI
jgi:transcriptional regulator with XRE-family HTH domain